MTCLSSASAGFLGFAASDPAPERGAEETGLLYLQIVPGRVEDMVDRARVAPVEAQRVPPSDGTILSAQDEAGGAIEGRIERHRARRLVSIRSQRSEVVEREAVGAGLEEGQVGIPRHAYAVDDLGPGLLEG